MASEDWTEEQTAGGWIFRPSGVPPGFLVAFSGRGAAPIGEPSPTAFLARRFARSLAMDGLPVVRAIQVHGRRAVTVRDRPGPGEVLDAGRCDILATGQTGVALVVQTADCVPIVLAGARSIGVVHAGWRGSAENAAAAAVSALSALGEAASSLRAFLGPSIGACCYEVGGEVAARFAGEFAARSGGGRFRLNLAAVNRAQLQSSGVPARHITAHPACTRCGGDRFASYRRDGAAAGRMIALAARLDP
ncbi:MAG TPA: polyphenol oxidase family protein [Thermoanaerobaculia bacterium]|nr:polyphenol oxidase family protein [Thermoanaerobaculia bacterium]